MRTIFYALMQNPRILNKLRIEIDETFETRQLSHPVQYSMLDKLPYFAAVIKECTRIFPSWQLTMPRKFIAMCGMGVCFLHGEIFFASLFEAYIMYLSATLLTQADSILAP